MPDSQVTKAKKIEQKKETRTPLYAQKSMLEAPPRKGWVRRWVKDVERRVDKFKLAGWKFVVERNLPVGDSSTNLSLGEGYRVHGGSDKQGKVFNLVLMEIPQIHYNQDQKAKQERDVDAVEKSILEPNEDEGFYRPKGYNNKTIHGVGKNRKMPK